MAETISIVIPVYNERRALFKTIKEIKNITSNIKDVIEIITVNDCSTDNTGDILNSIKGIKVITHKSNRGYGASLKTGIKSAKGHYILIMDADGTYPVKSIPKLVSLIKKHDMLIGLRKGKNVKIPLLRKPAKMFLNKFASFLSGKKIPDLNSGMRIFSKEKCLEFWNLYPERFSFTSTITMAFIGKSYSVKYIPIEYYKRQGKSSISPFDFYNFSNLLLRLTLMFNPLKIFGLISFSLICISLIIGIYSMFIMGNLMDVTVLILLMSSLQIFLFGLLAHMISKKWVL
ncbi:glycosyltransferase family 2 protein [Candidatus Woesearchaeota archaeon]|jgi:polyisoprenyl-phosphate glycosyltransferase|nr:glycosyltransferase family 2 protein [Candidatus Woesearchaeota archaeon]